MSQTPRVFARGQRTVIRDFVRADVDRMQEWAKHSDPLYAVYNIKRIPPRERDEWFEKHKNRPNYRMFAIDKADTGELIGRIALWDVSESSGSAALGIEIAANHINQGYGSDALKAFQDYYFGDLEFNILKLHVSAVNKRAQACYLKSGFVHTNLFWTPSAKQAELDIFGDERFAKIRHFFKQGEKGMECLFHEMTITRERWAQLKRERKEARERLAAQNQPGSR